MSLTESDITLIQNNWNTIRSELHIDAIGQAFYKNVFGAEPSLLALFTTFKDEDDMYSSPKFKRHAQKVINTVGTAVDSLKDMNSLVPVLKGLGGRHIKYGIKDEHYPMICGALMKTVEGALGDRFLADNRKAWEILMGIITNTMLQGAKEKHQKDAEAAAAAAAAAN